MLSSIAAEFFGRSPVLALPVIALVLFVAVFVATSVRALLTRKRDVAQLASLPLSE